jgi:hypothetical protein
VNAEEFPAISVERGDPTAEELAALVAALTVRAGEGDEDGPSAPEPVSGWTDRSRYVRGRLAHRTNGWRASGLPR